MKNTRGYYIKFLKLKNILNLKPLMLFQFLRVFIKFITSTFLSFDYPKTLIEFIKE